MAAYIFDDVPTIAVGLLVCVIGIFLIALIQSFQRRARAALSTLTYGLSMVALATSIATGGLHPVVAMAWLAVLILATAGLPPRQSVPLAVLTVVAVFGFTMAQVLAVPLPRWWIFPDVSLPFVFAVVALATVAGLHVILQSYAHTRLRSLMAAYEAEQRRLASLQQAKALDALFGALPVPAGIYDPQGMLRYANASYLSMLGKTPDTAIGRPLDQIWPRRAASLHAPYLAQTADGQSGRFALSFTTPDNVNREFDVCMVPQPLEGGRFDTLMLLLDRTENARAARALAERDNMYSAMVEHAPVAILTEVNGLVTFANPGALSMLGAEWAGRVVGRPFADFVVDDDRPRMRTRLAALAHAPGFAEFRPYRLSTLGGHVRDVELAAISVTRDGRQLVELFCVDTTERRTAEEKIRLLNETLELRVAERTGELEAFTTSVSHDLRAPARQVMAAADVMLAKADAPGSDLKPMLSALRTTAERMNRTIDALLELSRVGRSSMLQSVWPLGAMLHEIQSELSCLEPASRRIEWRIAPMPRVFADPQLIRLVLVNVVGNALKFSRNGHLTVVEIWSEERDQMIEIHVRDNGKGFDMKHAGKLFQMFSRLHSSSDFEGTGVGLAHCKRIVERHGGRIAARGVPDQGATVSFTLPHESASL